MIGWKVGDSKVMLKHKLPNSLYFYFGLYILYFVSLLFLERQNHIWLLSLACLFILAIYVYFKRKVLEATYKWETVYGILKKINIRKSFCSVRERFDFDSKPPYEIVVQYAYRYVDKTYQGNQYALNEPCNYHYEYKEALNIIKKLQNQADALPIKVNPSNPKVSVLVPGVDERYKPSYSFVLIVYGAIFITVPWMMI